MNIPRVHVIFFFKFTIKQRESLLSLVTELLAIAKAERESIINRQTALYSLKLLSRLLAKDYPSHFNGVSSKYCCINSAFVFFILFTCMWKGKF